MTEIREPIRSVENICPPQHVGWPKVTDWSKRLGSWGQTVKAAQGWDSDDLGFTVDALQGTAQNFCIYDVNLEEEWTEFLKLLEEVKGKDFKVFAEMQSPTTVATGNRWFGSEGPPAEPDIAEPRLTGDWKRPLGR